MVNDGRASTSAASRQHEGGKSLPFPRDFIKNKIKSGGTSFNARLIDHGVGSGSLHDRSAQHLSTCDRGFPRGCRPRPAGLRSAPGALRRRLHGDRAPAHRIVPVDDLHGLAIVARHRAGARARGERLTRGARPVRSSGCYASLPSRTSDGGTGSGSPMNVNPASRFRPDCTQLQVASVLLYISAVALREAADRDR